MCDAQLNKAFTVFFVLEMTIKLSLLGPVAYFMDGGNLFDFSITCLGLIEITVKVRIVTSILTYGYMHCKR